MLASELCGGCFCGAVRFEAREIFDTGYCHCSICRRFSGAPALAWANLPARSFRITRGSPKGFASSERWVRYFCAECGCPVFGRHPHPPEAGSDLVCFSILSLNEPLQIRPSVHTWCSARMPWFDTTDDLPRFPDGELSPSDTRRDE